jgi:hypothetical protein
MTTFQLTAKDKVPAVLIEIVGAPAGPVTIERRDVNGTAQVRLLPAQEPSAGTMVVYDYEAALAGEVWYTVTDTMATVTGPYLAVTAAPLPHLHPVTLPAAGQTVTAVRNYDATRAPSGAVHWPLGRTDPIVITAPARLRAGTLELYAGSYADARALEDCLLTGQVCMLRQPNFPGLDMYFTPLGPRVAALPEDTVPRRWTVTVPYQESRPPDGPLLSAAAWTFTDLSAAYPTFTAAYDAFDSFDRMTAGP